jgi:hypothetical protein
MNGPSEQLVLVHFIFRPLQNRAKVLIGIDFFRPSEGDGKRCGSNPRGFAGLFYFMYDMINDRF